MIKIRKSRFSVGLKEGYKREILRLRIENERLKKKYLGRQNEEGQTENGGIIMARAKWWTCFRAGVR